jgi:outer membrane protein assembly factor BamE (lipoprotein component of BamABCDE complex)
MNFGNVPYTLKFKKQFIKMNLKYFMGVLWLLSMNSCIVQSPKYTTLDQVISLELGMSKTQVEQVLGVSPYDLKAYADSNQIFIYVYRLVDRKTISFTTQAKNGKVVKGRYQQLHVTYSKNQKVLKIESCNTCPDNLVNTKKLDIQKMIVFITITLPILLVFIGLN